MLFISADTVANEMQKSVWKVDIVHITVSFRTYNKR